jgi:hypothetical protein
LVQEGAVKRLAVLLLVLVATLAAGAAPANATNECRGLNPCVPIAGPWVVVPVSRTVPRPQVQFQLTCPRGFIVGGVDAELTDRRVDVFIVGMSGSPVTPGVTTSRSVVFVASYVGAGLKPPTFRPLAGCIPATGGGQRTPTAASAAVPPGQPTVRRVRTAGVRSATSVAVSCRSGERLVAAYSARAFSTTAPPDATLIASLRATQQIDGNRVVVTAQGGQGRGLVQVAAVCAGGR